MALKRLLGEEADGDFEFPNKRPHLLWTSIFKGVSSSRSLQDLVPRLEPMIRRCVKEEMNRAIDVYLRSPDGQIESSGLRNFRLQFLNNLPHTVFTGNRIVSEDSSPIKFALYNSTSNRIVTSGPYSSMKVDVVVIEGDFVPECREDWLKEDFDRKVMQNRKGKRPLTTGDLIVSLQDGVGYVDDVSFTDNSSWTRSGKFRLAVQVHSDFDETSVREGISNAFRVKDHRGEAYQKHHPPYLNDEVWRLEKIAKDGPSHKRLTQDGISSVRDFLRSYAINQLSLRAVLRNVSNKKWDAIIAHAATCILDDKRYLYRTAQGTGLLFNSIYKVVGVIFDGHIYHSVDSLDIYQMRLVEDLKQRAYTNTNSWEECEAGPNIVPQNVNLNVGQGQLELQMNTQHAMISSAHGEVGQDNSSFGLAGSSQMLGLNLAFSNSFEMSDSPCIFYIGGQTWDSRSNLMDSQPSPQVQNFTVDDGFEVESYAKGKVVSFSSNHEICIISSNSRVLIPRNGSTGTRWCKRLVEVKWWILVRLNVAAR